VNSALLLLVSAAACPTSTPVPGALGLPAVAKLPAAEAMRLNGEGKQLYRQERWAEARAKYRAALAADPDLLGAQLNVACSFSRQGLYAEAADEVAKLVHRAFVPWNRETVEAADLGILQDQEVYARVQNARTEAAATWGKAVRDGIFFVARTKPPVNVVGQGILVLSLNQELFAWIPETGRYFQVTAEDGHVLAYAVSSDRRRVAYLLAGKLVRQAGETALLRGLSLRVLDITTMSPGKIVAIPGDVEKVQLWFASVPMLRVSDSSGKYALLKLTDDRLDDVSNGSPPGHTEFVELSPLGVKPAKQLVARANCGCTLATQKDSAGVWRIMAFHPKTKPFRLNTRYGAGLDGLPFPNEATPLRPAAELNAGKP
jgi:hypothetical protein